MGAFEALRFSVKIKAQFAQENWREF